MNLEKMSKDELKTLIKDATKALNTLETRRKAEAKKAAETAAKEYGFSLDDLLSDGSKKGSKGIAKYRNPADANQTWTGKGRKPNWVKEALEAGKSIEDLAI